MRKLLIIPIFFFLCGISYADDYIRLSGGKGGHTVQDESTSLTQRSKLDFQGAGVTVTDGGAGTDSTIVTIPGGGGSGSSYNLNNLDGYSTAKVLQVGGLGAPVGMVSGNTVSANSVTGNTVDVGEIGSNDGLITVYAEDLGTGIGGIRGIVLSDRIHTYGSWLMPSGADGITVSAALGKPTSLNGAFFINYYSSGFLQLCQGGGDVNIYKDLYMGETDGDISARDYSTIYFGAGDNAGIYYNGVNLVINPKFAGTGIVDLGNANIGTGGTITGNTVSGNTATTSSLTADNAIVNGRMAIGTSTLNESLNVAGNIRSSAGAAQGFTIYSGSTLLGSFLRGTADATAVAVLQGVTSRPITVQNTDASANIFQWTNSSSQVLGLIDNAGKLGVANKTPTHTLDVGGTGYVNGTLGIGGVASANSVSFNTIAPVSTNTVLVAGAYTLPTYNPPSGTRMALWNDGNGSVSWNTAAVTSGGGGGGGSPFTNASITLGFNAGNSPLTTGDTVRVCVPYAGTLTKWELLSDKQGQVQVDIDKCTYANFDTYTQIDDSNQPFLLNAKKNTQNCIGWSTAVVAGDYFKGTITSIDTVTGCTVTLFITRSS